MRGGALPPALLCAALGFALAFAPRRAIAPSLVAVAVGAILAAFLRVGAEWLDAVFFGCWSSVILAAASVHLPRGLSSRLALIFALNTGLWSGAVIAAAGKSSDLFLALPWVLLCLPGQWIVAKKWQVVIKVVASWLIAVAVLVATIPAIHITPGYKPDHME